MTFIWSGAFAICVITLVFCVDSRLISLRFHSTLSSQELHDLLMIQSTPGTREFRKHKSLEELRELTTASNACLASVSQYLDHIGATDVHHGVLMDQVFANHQDPESVFGAPLQTNVQFGKKALLVPEPLASCVRWVFLHPTTDLSVARRRGRISPRRGLAASSSSASGSTSFPGMIENPRTISSRYGIPLMKVDSSVPFSQGVAEFEGEQFYQSNVDSFNSHYDIQNNTIKISGPNKGGYFGEGNLDLEYIQSLATDATTWWIAEKEFDFTLWTENVLSIKPMPLVLSVSWGSGESGFDNSSMQADSEDFRKLSLLGATVLAASGDQGTGSTGFLTCGTFDPTFPASSPYVTAVGGTYAESESGDEESWNGSGGGFSTVFPAPTYQTAAIAEYVRTAVMPPSEYYTPGGRGIPDVAALATNFESYSFGWGTETGTSAATPSFSSIIARINIARIKQQKSPLGFINPTLYMKKNIGFDVTVGNNMLSPCPAGFNATVGWDAISGLGTPLYNTLVSILEA